ncbi:hypothetical protein ACROYT_G040662 [Oculina patagonica]
MATMKKQKKKCKSIKHVPIPVHKEGVDKHSSTAEMQIAWTMLSSCHSRKNPEPRKLGVQLIYTSPYDLRRSVNPSGMH